jgi:four helix bundle protein
MYIGPMRDLKNLRVYEPARAVALRTYRLSTGLPRAEEFGLRSQMRRAAVSVVANIAESHGRGTDGDFERHLRIAAGSLSELEALLDLAADLEFLDARRVSDLRDDCRSLGRMLVALTRTVGRARKS